MSRCFPYPAPGYSLEKVGNEALVESIKLQMETERVAKEQMKKEKRKEKKEKRKQKDETKACTEKLRAAPKSGCFTKVREAETEHLEKSSVTEEHEQPIYLCLPSSPSDSTGNSNKRKRQSSSLVGSHNRGNIIRIRLLPPKKPKEHDTTGRIDFSAQHKNEITNGVGLEKNFSTKENRSIVGAFPIETVKEPVCSTSGRDDAAAASVSVHGKARIASGHGSFMTKMQKVELEYKSLFENWDPPQLQAPHIGQDDEEWLFRGRNLDVRVERKLKSFSDPISCSSTSVSGPRAQYLHEADVYALPFTIPF